MLAVVIAAIATLSLQAADPAATPKKKAIPADLLKKYDKNGNGKLDDDEREVYRADMKKQREELLNKRNADREKVQPKEEKKDEKK